jgi:predicted RNase H-like nuclease (RuvC/YqgF family)
MAIIHQHDKRSGITYAYESISYWDKEKKQSRAKRKLIGRVDPETGEITPTDGRGKKGKVTKAEEDIKDYKTLYEKLQKKCMAQETLIEALKKEIEKLKGEK